jgi:hypothetical protein
MTGRSCRRLLACSLIFVESIVVAPISLTPPLRAQDAAANRSLVNDPIAAPSFALSLSPSAHSSPIAPVWIPPPPQPRRGLVSPGRSGFPHLLPQLVRVAGIIFSGRVTSIGFAPAHDGQAPASTTVTFQVEHAMRGASAGQSLTVYEWAGLWSSGERYRVGEQVLLFLYSPGKLGLTSPVAGAMGRFAIDSRGRVVMSPQQVAALGPVLGGKTFVPYGDFVEAVRRSSGEE